VNSVCDFIEFSEELFLTDREWGDMSVKARDQNGQMKSNVKLSSAGGDWSIMSYHELQPIP
jgi:hypothetical protein